MGDIITEEMYDTMWCNFRSGHISEQEWREFCNELLSQVLDDNKDVLVRLKYR